MIEIPKSVTSVEWLLSQLESKGYPREALVARLGYQGERLGEILGYRRNYFFVRRPLPGNKGGRPPLNLFTIESMRLQWTTESDVLAVIVDAAILSRDPVRDDVWLSSPMFPSRKGRAPMQPRTMQRLLKSAIAASSTADVSLTFRKFFSVGLENRLLNEGDRAREAALDAAEGKAIEGALAGLQRLLRTLYPNQHDRQDAAQEARFMLTTILRRKRRSTGEVALNVRALAARVIRSQFSAFKQRHAARPEALFPHFEGVLTTDTDSVESMTPEQKAREVIPLISNLPSPQRELVRYMFVENRTLKATSELTGLSQKKAFVLAHRGLDRLKTMFWRSIA